MTNLDKKEDKEIHLAAQPLNEDWEEKLFSEEVFKDDLEFSGDIENLPF